MRAKTLPQGPGPVMADLIAIYTGRFESAGTAEETKAGRRKALKRILRTWEGFQGLRAGDVTAEAVWSWAGRLRAKGSGFRPPGAKGPARAGASASAVNQAIAALQDLLEIARETGAVLSNVAAGRPPAGFGRLKVRAEPKRVHVPPQETVRRLFDEIERPDEGAPARIMEAQKCHRRDAGELCRFLGYSGARVGEARRAVWGDDRGAYLIIHGTKSAQSRERALPFNPGLRELLDRIRQRRAAEAARRGEPPPGPGARILRVGEAQKTIDRACAALGIPRLTHHDLRHLFATCCLESGVDPKTLAAWLGHADGGTLVLRTYGHVRPEHGILAAAKVVF